ncbi:MAG: 16S rRNA processing protein RimM [Balneolaceae bacterium]|nr:MAG: 16S rRNA processing protein RimM [Balneolaceae bacterium]
MGVENSGRYVEIGRIGKARGLHGVVKVIPDSPDYSDLLAKNSLVYLKENIPGFIPLRVEDLQTENKRNQQSFFVKFDRITNRSDAEKASDKSLWADQKKVQLIQKNRIVSDESPIGYLVYYNGSLYGEVLDIIENPAHPILEVKTKTGLLLIPMVDEYISETDHRDKTLTGLNLDQLSEL